MTEVEIPTRIGKSGNLRLGSKMDIKKCPHPLAECRELSKQLLSRRPAQISSRKEAVLCHLLLGIFRRRSVHQCLQAICLDFTENETF